MKKTAEEIANKHGLPTYDPIQWHHIKRAMEEYASQFKGNGDKGFSEEDMRVCFEAARTADTTRRVPETDGTEYELMYESFEDYKSQLTEDKTKPR